MSILGSCSRDLRMYDRVGRNERNICSITAELIAQGSHTGICHRATLCARCLGMADRVRPHFLGFPVRGKETLIPLFTFLFVLFFFCFLGRFCACNSDYPF